MTLCLLLVVLVGWVAGFASAIWLVKWVARDLDRQPPPPPLGRDW
jgi:hypothetical protein